MTDKILIDRELLEQAIEMLEEDLPYFDKSKAPAELPVVALIAKFRAAMSAPQHDLPSADDRKDAKRWRAVELLMYAGNVELNQDDDGGYSISFDPVENEVGKAWRGNEPSDVADKLVEEINRNDAAMKE